jgi:hypothetical protein
MDLKGYVKNQTGSAKVGLTVELYAATDLVTVVDTTVTDADGMWTFTGLTETTVYAVKIIDGLKVLWLDGRSMMQTSSDLVSDFTVKTIPPTGSPERNFGVEYQNTTGKALIVTLTVWINMVGNYPAYAVFVTGPSSANIGRARFELTSPANDISIEQNLTIIVPKGHYYKFNKIENGSSTIVLEYWQEQTLG